MTTIKYKDRPTWHQTGLVDDITGRPYLVAQTPTALLIREKGRRDSLRLPWNIAYFRAATLRAYELRCEKREKKASRKRVRRGALAGL